ncbi:MAG: hypothetical protein ACRC14_10705 [Paracoccaceae bacterium]
MGQDKTIFPRANRHLDRQPPCSAGKSARPARMWQVTLPLAVPTLVVGVNQSSIFALFMVNIAALIGTPVPGARQAAGAVNDWPGQGAGPGFSLAFMGLMADHVVLKWARARSNQLSPNQEVCKPD